jgi:acetolactate synthase-1/2/3 large subunit
MQSGRPGPAVLECAMDMWGKSGPPAAPHPPELTTEPSIDKRAIAAAANILAASRRVLIVTGGGAQDASAEVTELSQILQAPYGIPARARRARWPQPVFRDIAARA